MPIQMDSQVCNLTELFFLRKSGNSPAFKTH
jgi:hypothetical protein